MSDSPDPAIRFIEGRSRILVSTHVNPDGDGIGAVLALKWALSQRGVDADIIIESEPPETLGFLANYQWVGRMSEEAGNVAPYDTVIVADAPHTERLGAVKSLISDNAEILIIDHHPTDQPEGTARYINESASSSCELVYNIITAMGLSPDKDCSEYLYTGIIVDTGRFRFSNTSHTVLRIASELVKAGADPNNITERLFYHNTIETTMALGRMINSIKLHLGGKMATACYSHEFVTSEEWKKVDTEGFVNHALAIRGVEVAALLREVKPGVTRASLRSKNDFDVNRLANTLGGGGHSKAAGCTIEEDLSTAIKKLVKAVKERL